jgi:hypothetical protein
MALSAVYGQIKSKNNSRQAKGLAGVAFFIECGLAGRGLVSR